MKTKTNKNLGVLMFRIRALFKAKKENMPTNMFSLTCNENGYWSINITDDWHKWLEKGIKYPTFTFATPELACEDFLNFVKRNKINIKRLQSK